jgi:prepilin-type N-terminal cleavage/methylation domain-containing protein/prepilin-type processing-associated H-X9-DG protein
LAYINVVKHSVKLKQKETSGFEPNVNFPLFCKWRRREAFTLIELLVVIAIIAILASVLLPVLHQAQLRGQTAACIANQSQLAKGWIMYAGDNNDYCPGNLWQDEQNWHSYPHENWVSGWVGVAGSAGNGGVPGAVSQADNTNTTLLVNPTYSTIGDYTRIPKLYICPASEVRGSVGASPNPDFIICRTVSMNCWVGYNTDVLGAPTHNPAYGAYFSSAYKVFQRLSDIKAGIGPSDLFVFMEERAESIDDGWFAINGPGNLGLVNWPTDYHNEAATIGFADGHVEVHRWQNAKFSGFGSGTPTDANFLTPQDPTPPGKWGGATVSAGFPGGLFWMEQHATCYSN